MKTVFLLVVISLLLGCGVKLKEESAHHVMGKLYEARKKGSFYKEFTLYAKDEFKMVPFDEVESTLRTVVGGSGRFKSAKHISTKISRRNQLGEGLISYMVLTYEATYTNATLTEAYYFLGDSKIPKLVYMTLQY